MSAVVQAVSNLQFWGVMHKNDWQTCLQEGCIPVRFSHRTRWGVRRDPSAALARARLFEPDASRETHALFLLKFTLEGYAVYTQLAAENGWPVFYRHGVVQNEEVWHFQGDIPMRANGPGGNLLSVERFDIE